jgi:hypothetical protein
MKQFGTLFEDEPPTKAEALKRAEYVSEFMLQEIVPSWLSSAEHAHIRIYHPDDMEGWKFVAVLLLSGFQYEEFKARLPYADEVLVHEGNLISKTIITLDATVMTLVTTMTPLTDENREEGLQLISLFQGGMSAPEDKRRLN